MPAVQPAELWQESGRWGVYGKELLRFLDRHERDYCFGPTHEEVITDLVRREVHSYRQLPLNLYQIQTKFRDEIRPRFGLIRSREFIMKDAYSFHKGEAGAEACYQDMYDAYNRIFERCGLKFKVVEADSGPIGGSFSHEFMVLADTGRGPAGLLQGLRLRRQPGEGGSAPGFAGARRRPSGDKELVATPGVRTVEEVAAFLKVTPKEIVKTLIYETERGPVAILIRGDHEVNEVKVKNLLGVTDLALAGLIRVQELTGAEAGFAGPVGLEIPIYADQAVVRMNAMVTGANQDNHHLLRVHPQRDFKIAQVADLRAVTAQDPCPRCRGELTILRGIEVGHIFKLGHQVFQGPEGRLPGPGGGRAIYLHGLLRHRGEPHRGRGHRTGPRRPRHYLPHGPGPGAGGSDPHFPERRRGARTASLSCTRNWKPRASKCSWTTGMSAPG